MSDIANLGLVVQVARLIDPAIWIAFDTNGRDGFGKDKPSEVMVARRKREASVQVAREIIALVRSVPA